LDDRDSYRFRLPGHCGIFTAEMCAITFICYLIEPETMGAYIILTDSLASIEGLKSTCCHAVPNQEVPEISGGTWV
jgi:hypothetical protein